MATLNITNKYKPEIVYKSFKCNITKFCNVVVEFNDVLYHDGENILPVNGDKIYIKTTQEGPGVLTFQLFKNNTAALYITTNILSTNDKSDKYNPLSNLDTIRYEPNPDLEYVVTNNDGVCEIKKCKNIWQLSESQQKK